MSANLDELKTDYVRTPIAKLTQVASGLHMIYKDYWWIVTPEEELLRWRNCSWQCNQSRAVVEHIMPKDCGLTARQIPLVCVPVNANDYAYN